MKLYILKIKEKYLMDILYNDKNFVIGKNDGDYEVGDLIHFVDENGKEYDRCIDIEKAVFRITYILKDVPEYGLDKDYCILSIKRLENY